MNANDYQQQAARTLIDKPGFELPDRDMMLVWVALGLGGEAGEVLDVIKKGVLHQHGLDEEKLAKEIGDTAWYLAGLCTLLGVNFGDVMQANIDKLKKRYPNGFSSDDSQRRVDVK